MYYTLKEMAKIAGLNERTVLNYMQGTRRAHAAPTAERRFWQFTEEDLTALREAKLHAEQERTRTAHAGYMQPTDTRALEARVVALEQQVAALLSRSTANLTPAIHSTVYEPPRRASASTVRHTRTPARPPLPAHLMSIPTWVERHGVRQGTVKTWRERRYLPVERGQWLEAGVRIDTALTLEGREMAHQLAHLPWPCEVCAGDGDGEENEAPHIRVEM